MSATSPHPAALAWRLLPIHALVWTAAAWLSRGNLDIPGDMVENFVWGQEWQAGYAKHPPLFAWVTAAWFAVLPRTDWAYFALSAVNAGLGLCGVAALARRFVDSDGTVLATLALAVSPLYTALAIKFNANAILLSTWPWTAYFFVAWMQQPGRRHPIAFGACAALALLGKYFSAVLLAALLLALVVRPAWRARCRGPGPWLAAGTFALVLMPHGLWLMQHDFATFGYAAQRSGGSLVAAVLRYVNYCVAQLLYLLPCLAFMLFAVAPGQRRRAAAALLAAWSPRHSPPDLWWLSFAPLLVAGALALSMATPLASVWGMAQWFAITTLWASLIARAGLAVSMPRMVRALAAYWLVVLLAAAVVGHESARRGAPLAAEPRAELARAAQALWHQRTGQSLRFVSGSTAEAGAIAFYADHRISWWNMAAPQTSPWAPLDRVRQFGTLIICADAPGACDDQARGLTRDPPELLVVQKRAWGRTLMPHNYRAYLMLPPGQPISPRSN